MTADTLKPPTALVVAANAGTLVLTWAVSASTYADGYYVYRAAATGGPYTNIATVTGRATTTWTDATPPGGISYYKLAAYRYNWLSGETTISSGTAVAPVTITTVAYTGAPTSYVVPTGVTSLTLETWGAGALTGGGKGGYTKGDLVVSAGQVLWLYVGGVATGLPGGWNGGGAGVVQGVAGNGGGGGTDVRAGGTALANRVIVGGGASGTIPGYNSMDGGGIFGLGAPSTLRGTQTSGFALGQGGPATVTGSLYGGAGGGGGYWGGYGTQDPSGGYAGGGSGYTGGVTNPTMTTGVRVGNGQIMVTANAPATGRATTYTYNAGAQTYTVPAGVSSIRLESFGQQHTTNSVQPGGYARGDLAVTPGEILNINISLYAWDQPDQVSANRPAGPNLLLATGGYDDGFGSADIGYGFVYAPMTNPLTAVGTETGVGRVKVTPL